MEHPNCKVCDSPATTAAMHIVPDAPADGWLQWQRSGEVRFYCDAHSPQLALVPLSDYLRHLDP